MTMKKQSVDLQSLLSSSLQINSYKSAVEELVHNSLDAKAISIAIRVDIEQNKIQVIDNGHGITEKDFDVLGQKYMTSKCVDLNTLKSLPNTYGYRGQSLANIISISRKVKITSRGENKEDTWVKIFLNGKLRELAKTASRPSIGTTVEITGLFYNLHIQNKAVDAIGELNDIKVYLKQLALVHTNISISLRDNSKNEIIFEVHKNRDVYQTLKLLFDVDRSNIQELKVEKNKYKVTAYIGKNDKDLSKHQWIYLNMKHLNKSKLHKIVNDYLMKSLKNVNKRKVKSKIADNEEVNQTNPNIPFYIILISCPYYDYDINDVSKQTIIEFKDWQDITQLLEKLIKFYTGDKSLKKQLKPTKINESERKEKGQTDDTRDQVRKIVQKLLKSGTKKLGVSQMQNGVKGKLIKRKMKKRPINISISKVIPTKNSTKLEPINRVSESNVNNEDMIHKNIPKVIISEKSIINKNLIKKVKQKNIDLTKEITSGFEKNNTKKSRKTSNNADFNKKSKIKRSIIKKNPLNVSLSIKSKGKQIKKKMIAALKSPHVINPSYESYINQIQRCLDIEDKYENIEENFTNIIKHRYKNNHKISVHESIQFSNIINSNKNVSIRKRIEEVIVYDFVPHPLNPGSCDNKQNQNNHNTKLNNVIVSSHDLIKTILNSQCQRTNPKNRIRYTGTRNENLPSCYFEPSLKFNNQLSNNLFMSRLTYESHDYNKKNIAQNTNVYNHNMKRQFITKQSRDNFLGTLNKQNRKILNNKQLKKIFHDEKFNFNTGSKMNVWKNNYLQESSYVIEFSESNDKERRKKAKQIINSPRFFSDTRKKSRSDRLNVNQKEVPNSDELRVENTARSILGNTYTINNHVLSYLSEVNIDSHYFEKDNFKSSNDLQTTFAITKNANNNMKNISENLSNEHNDLNPVYLSKSQANEVAVNEAQKNIHPLNVCDAILSNNSNDIIEDEISFNLSGINFNNSLFNFDLDILNKDIAKCTRNTHNSDEIDNTQTSKERINIVKKSINTTNKNKTEAVNIEEMKLYNEVNTKHNDRITIDDTIIDTKKDADEMNSFNIKNRLNFVPKGMSQIFENCNTRTGCEYYLDEEYFETIMYNNFANNVQIHTEIYEPRIQNVTVVADTKIEKINTKLRKENASLIFDGKSLEQAKVLGQVDGKFIAAIIKTKSNSARYLVLFDQHAVHERIRLEKNLSDYLGENEWNSVNLDNISLKLSKDEIIYLHNYKEKFAQFGLHWDVVNNSEVSVNAIPEAILGKNPRQADKIIDAVKNLILEEISILKTQRGCISLHPKSIMELVFSEACRYAIKFGDKLTMDDCVDLLHSLSECKTPFQCAHGRPVMAVLLDLSSADNVYEYKADISKVIAFHKQIKK